MVTVGQAGRVAGLGLRLGAAGLALGALARAATRRVPLAPATDGEQPISVIVPARDEADRIGPCLDAVAGAPGVVEVVVVDDGSTDATAAIARRRGARVVEGAPLPEGWAGKPWALQQGIEAARGEWVVTLDADTRADPELPRAAVARARADGADLLTVAGRFECPTAALRWVHPAMLTTLVYRFGPPGAPARRPERLLANGQCLVARREPLLAAGGLTPVAGHVVEDVALARHLARQGWRVGFVDGASLLRVRMHEDARDALRGWSRSLALPGVEPPARQLVGAGVVALVQVAPLWRLVTGRGDPLDLVLAALRLGVLAGTARAYDRRGPAYWLSPLADPLALGALVTGSLVRRRTWRGRTYAPARTAGRRTS